MFKTCVKSVLKIVQKISFITNLKKENSTTSKTRQFIASFIQPFKQAFLSQNNLLLPSFYTVYTGVNNNNKFYKYLITNYYNGKGNQ